MDYLELAINRLERAEKAETLDDAKALARYAKDSLVTFKKTLRVKKPIKEEKKDAINDNTVPKREV